MECGLDGGLAVVGVFINSIAIKNMENKMQLNLEVDEEIVWIGNPNKKLTFTRGDVFILAGTARVAAAPLLRYPTRSHLRVASTPSECSLATRCSMLSRLSGSSLLM